jgi:DNA-binding transcriptional LysR family regulator
VELITQLRRLQVLHEVATNGSFSAAADALAMTQSAVSQHIAALERSSELPLVERGTRPVQLTEAGFTLVRHSRAVLARLETAQTELDELAGRREGRLRLGSFPTALATFVPSALSRFARRAPSVNLVVVDDHLQRLLPRLAGGELDLAIVYDHEATADDGSGGLERVHLHDDAYRVVLPPGHRLARRRGPIALTELADDTWVGGGPASSWFQIVRHTCRTAGFDPKVNLTSDDYVAIQAFVEAGLGVTVIPGLAVARTTARVHVRDVGGAGPVRRLWVARNQDAFPTTASRTMVEILRQTSMKFVSQVS